MKTNVRQHQRNGHTVRKHERDTDHYGVVVIPADDEWEDSGDPIWMTRRTYKRLEKSGRLVSDFGPSTGDITWYFKGAYIDGKPYVVQWYDPWSGNGESFWERENEIFS